MRTVALTLLGKPGCHLCEVAREELERLRGRLPGIALVVAEVDVSQDPGLRRQFRLDLPVLLLEGRRLFRHRVDSRQLARRLLEGVPTPLEEEDARAAGVGAAGVGAAGAGAARAGAGPAAEIPEGGPGADGS